MVMICYMKIKKLLFIDKLQEYFPLRVKTSLAKNLKNVKHAECPFFSVTGNSR